MQAAASKLVRFVRGALRNSPWLVIAVGVHAIAIVVLTVVQLAEEPRVAVDAGFRVTARAPAESLAPIAPEPETFIHVIPPAVETELTASETIYTPQVFVDPALDLSQEVGDPTADVFDGPPNLPGGSTNIGVGDGPSRRGEVGGNPNYVQRSGPTSKGKPGRAPLGSTLRIEESVLEGLRWLCRHQRDDGSWGPRGMEALCTPGEPCIAAEASTNANYDEGLTGLALLAFLGAGHAHDSKVFVIDTPMQRRYDLGPTVKRGLQWLVKRQCDDGSFCESGYIYNEALATMALCEAYGMTRNRYWKQPAQRAVDFLVRAQKRTAVDGSPWGWRYRSAESIDNEHAADTTYADERYARDISESDISVTCWAVMALKSARMSKLNVPEDALQGALAFARSVADDQGRAGYLDRAGAGLAVGGVGEEFTYHLGTPTALDMLVRSFVARDLSDPFLAQGAQHLVRDLPSVSKERLSVDYYYWYHASLALIQFDGEASPRHTGAYWKPWRRALETALVALQQPVRKGACSSGAWLVDDRWSHAGHALYNTAINTLTFEVFNRYPNAFGTQGLELVDTESSDGAAGAEAAAK